MIVREATVADIESLSFIRMSVKENILNNPALVTEQDYIKYLTTHGRGWLCEINSTVTGFAIADITTNNIWALFICPNYENKGIGNQLHRIMMNWYFSQTDLPAWLSTSPVTRAAGFYLRHGWTPTGRFGNEIKFEISKDEWESFVSNTGYEAV